MSKKHFKKVKNCMKMMLVEYKNWKKTICYTFISGMPNGFTLHLFRLKGRQSIENNNIRSSSFVQLIGLLMAGQCNGTDNGYFVYESISNATGNRGFERKA